MLGDLVPKALLKNNLLQIDREAIESSHGKSDSRANIGDVTAAQ
jgi:hypothetical protein